MDERKRFISDEGKPLPEEMQVQGGLNGLRDYLSQECQFDLDAMKSRTPESYQRIIEQADQWLAKAKINLAEWKQIGSRGEHEWRK